MAEDSSIAESSRSRDDEYDLVREQERARKFFQYGLPVVSLVAVANIVIGIKTSQLAYIVAGSLPGMSAIAFALGARRAAAGQVASAMLLSARTAILTCSLNALIFPDQFPAYEMVIVLSISLALPHVKGPELTRFLRFAMSFGILMPLACLWLPLPHRGDAFEHRMMISFALVPTFAIAMLLLVQFTERLRDAVVRLIKSRSAVDRAEALAREEAANLRATLDSRRDAVISIDGQEHATYFNPAAQELFELQDAGAKQSKVSDFVHFVLPNENATITSLFDDARRTGKTVTFPEGTCITSKAGKRIPVAASYTPLRHGAVLAVEDISEKLRAEAMRVARDAAVAVARTRSEFLANMSHEIRTPMNAVIGMTGLLDDTHLNAQQREFVETIRSSGSHLLTIINDILDFSKIDAGALEFEHYEFDVRKCVQEAVELSSTAAARKGIELLIDIRRDVPARVQGDAGRLRQVLVNLIGNAVKFTEKGEVVVSLSAKPADEDRVDLRFSVQDTGIGIPKDRMDRLFKPFGQVDGSSTRRFGGTGLGLVISKQLVERMHGAFEVESVEAKGTTFSFNIILDVGDPVSGDSMVANQEMLKSKRILIVDDNAASRRILSTYCEAWGIQCVAVERPGDALRHYRNETFDLVLLDYNMPGMNGVELAREMTSQHRGPPLLLLSSLGVTLQDGDSQLFASRLLKPIRESQLFEQILAALERRDRTIVQKAASAPVDRPDPGLRILLVEDNQINQRIAILFLEKLGLQADVAADGEEAILAVRRQTYDAVLMDVQMPRMDGLEATRHLCTQYARDQRPFIIGMTAHALASDRDECFEAGMDDYLQKPVNLAALSAALKRASERPRRA